MFKFNEIKELKENNNIKKDNRYEIEKERWLKKFAKYWGKKTTLHYFKKFYEAFLDYEVIWLFFSFLTLIIKKTPLEEYLMTIQHYLPFRKELEKYLREYEDHYVVYFIMWWEVFDTPYIKAKFKNNLVVFSEFLLKCMLLFIYPLKGKEFFDHFGFDNGLKKMEELKKQLKKEMNLTESAKPEKKEKFLNKIESFVETSDIDYFNKELKDELLLILNKVEFLYKLDEELLYCIGLFYRKKIIKMKSEDFNNLKHLNDKKEIINFFGEKYFNIKVPESFFELVFEFNEEFKDLLKKIYSESGGITLYDYITTIEKKDIEIIKNKFFKNNYNCYLVFTEFVYKNDEKKDEVAIKEDYNLINIINKIKDKFFTKDIDEKMFVVNFLNLFYKNENLAKFFNFSIYKLDDLLFYLLDE